MLPRIYKPLASLSLPKLVQAVLPGQRAQGRFQGAGQLKLDQLEGLARQFCPFTQNRCPGRECPAPATSLGTAPPPENLSGLVNRGEKHQDKAFLWTGEDFHS